MLFRGLYYNSRQSVCVPFRVRYTHTSSYVYPVQLGAALQQNTFVTPSNRLCYVRCQATIFVLFRLVCSIGNKRTDGCALSGVLNQQNNWCSVKSAENHIIVCAQILGLRQQILSVPRRKDDITPPCVRPLVNLSPEQGFRHYSLTTTFHFFF